MPPPDEFYRYYDMRYEGRVRIHLATLWLHSETPKGYWLSNYQFGREKHVWVSKTARKRHAYPTVEEAMTSFKARKARQVQFLTHQLEGAKRALDLANEGRFCYDDNRTLT